MKFTKMEGIGNDYVYVDCTKNELKKPSELAKKVSDRHFGIGSDGLILICNSDIADFRMKMFNSDGSEAEMCGNGIRCVGKFIYDNDLSKKTELTIETLAGIKNLKLNVKDNKVSTVTVDMGEPILEAKNIPVEKAEIVKSNDGTEFNKVNLKLKDKQFEFTCVSMGNPHAVAFIDKTDDFELDTYGKIAEVDEHFPKKVNAEFIEIVDKNNIKMRVWERGAGETLACGTGACASVVASYLNDLTDCNVTVHLLGGDLNIEWNKQDNHIYMTGPATTVFTGEIDVEKL